MQNTMIGYLYRDGANRQLWNKCIIRGVMTEEQQKRILSYRVWGKLFIPHNVGLPEKTFTTMGYAHDPFDDTPWFELYETSFAVTDKEPTVEITPAELVQKFEEARPEWEKLVVWRH